MSTIYTFGPFRLDAEAGILFRGADPVALGQRAVALLRILVERQGVPASKDALIEAAWLGQPVEESNLSVQIAALRRALGEEHEGNRWIETLPRRGYRFIGPVVKRDHDDTTGAPAPPGSARPQVASSVPRLSVVVLPFVSIGGDPAQEYFVDGVTEYLTTDLSRIAGLFVIARNSAFSYKGKSIDARLLRHELGVSYILKGSMQRGNERLRVNVQLVDTERGKQVWADRFDKPIADLFEMQDEIVSRLANTLNVELIAAEARRAEHSPSPDSVDLYFQGAAWLNKGPSPANLHQARNYFERALACDSNNLESLVGMASTEAQLAIYFLVDDKAARLAAPEATLKTVLSFLPNHALAHSLLGFIQIFTNRAGQGIAQCERALALDRNLAAAYGLIGGAKFVSGRGEETEACIRQALRLSPLDTNAYVWLAWMGNAQSQLGADEEAASWYQKGIEANRNFPINHFFLAGALALLGRLDEARAAAKEGLGLAPSFTVRRFRLAAATDNPRYLAGRERLCEGMSKAGVPQE
jgi:TolB-like protein/Tfp pilus assembly protein PilF